MTAAPWIPALGITETFRSDDHDGVARTVDRLSALGIRHIRLPVSVAGYEQPGGAAWYDWLLNRLGDRFEVLPSLSVAMDAATFIERHGGLFDFVEITCASGELASNPHRPDDSAPFERIAAVAAGVHRLGKRAVLGGVGPTGGVLLDAMRRQGGLGIFAAIGVCEFPERFDDQTWPGWSAILAAVEQAVASSSPAPAVWITQTGYSTWRHDVAGQVHALRDAMATAVERVYWSSLQDGSTPASRRSETRSRYRGLDDAAGQPKLLARLLEKGQAGIESVAALATPALLACRPVLVTGGAGFIGSNLVDRLAGEGHDVLVLDALSRPGVERNLQWLRQRHPRRVAFSIADIRDDEALARAAAGAEAVFHLAGQVAVTTSMQQPRDDFDINAGATLTLLEALRIRNPTAPVVFASTNKVYGSLADIALSRRGDRYMPHDPGIAANGVSEARPLQFHTPYGCSKGAADQYVLDYAHSFGLRTAVLRMSCIYGERQLGTEDQGWVAHFLLRAIAGLPITLYGDGAQVRDVLHVGDAVGAYMNAWQRIDRIAGRAYNLGGGPANAISLLQLVAHIEHILDRTIDVAFAVWRPGDQRYYVSDTTQVRRDLDLALPLDWRSGVARLAQHFGADATVAQLAEASL